jgi:hypothetical protein
MTMMSRAPTRRQSRRDANNYAERSPNCTEKSRPESNVFKEGRERQILQYYGLFCKNQAVFSRALQRPHGSLGEPIRLLK